MTKPGSTKLEVTPKQILEEDLFWFPVRHHSPTSAHFLDLAIKKRKPRLILLEAPAHLQHLIPFLQEKTQPPIALYSSARLNDENIESDIKSSVSWYPLLDYSPEWQALMGAKKEGSELRFIDLPHYLQEAEEGESNTSINVFEMVAKRTGYLNWHECWDTLFENPQQFKSYEHYREQLLEFAAEARQFDTSYCQSAENLDRERFMWQQIQQAKADVDTENILVVCGALHAFMPREKLSSSKPVLAPNGVTITSTLSPYNFNRVAKQSGYAAGNRAPFYYQQLWQGRKQNSKALVINHVQRVLHKARQLGEKVSNADNIAVCQHAYLIAQLRGRETPVLDDIEDAIWACCCKGDPAQQGKALEKALQWANIGSKVGSVNPELGQVPLVKDFYHQLSLLDIEIPSQGMRVPLPLDLRSNEDRSRSQLLHKLALLELPCIELSKNRHAHVKSQQENWHLNDVTGTEEILLELSQYGDSIETLIQHTLKEYIEQNQHQIVALTDALLKSLKMGLNEIGDYIKQRCDTSLQNEIHFSTLCKALGNLLSLWQQQKYSGLNENDTQVLLEKAFTRSCLALSYLKTLEPEEENSFITGLRLLSEITLNKTELNVDRSYFLYSVENKIEDHSDSIIRGACFGLLLETGQKTLEQFRNQLLSFTDDPTGETLITASEWLSGVLMMTKVSILKGADIFTEAVDMLIKNTRWEKFSLMLPHLRKGFSALPEVQRQNIGLKVAEMYGLRTTEEINFKPKNQSAFNVIQIDNAVQSIMEDWDLK